MFPLSFGVFTRVLIIAAVSLTLAVGWPSPSRAAQPDEEAISAIVFETFPHKGADSNFWNSWGAPRSGGRRHKGVDIMGQRGDEIVAVADGVVTAMDESRMSGYFIRIQHDGFSTVMMHLNNDTYGTDDGQGGRWTAFYPTLRVGDHVTAGQVVGYIGDSGNAEGTSPHTHFEVKIDGVSINPYRYLVAAWRRHFRLPIPVAGYEAL